MSGLNRWDRLNNADRSRVPILALVILGLGLIFIGVALFLRIDILRSTELRQPSVTPTRVNFRAPDLVLQDLAAMPVALEDYRGQVILVNIWTTWCPPCKAEMPTLEAFYRDNAGKGFLVVAIDAGEEEAEVVRFVDQLALTFPVWLDPRMDSLAAFKYPGLPSSYVIDRDGVVKLAWTGAISRPMLDRHVGPLLED